MTEQQKVAAMIAECDRIAANCRKALEDMAKRGCKKAQAELTQRGWRWQG